MKYIQVFCKDLLRASWSLIFTMVYAWELTLLGRCIGLGEALLSFSNILNMITRAVNITLHPLIPPQVQK